ncbi:MAG: hypothetical protein E6Q66_06795 [Pedobacter sp.]|nr:MAG: hypothetical protein E6Q66_06795 [Pedobacter sp.]
MRKKRTLEKVELDRVRQNMPYGWQKKLAQDTGKSESMVKQVMGHRRNNGLIVTKAIDLSGLSEIEKTFLKSKLLFIHELN